MKMSTKTMGVAGVAVVALATVACGATPMDAAEAEQARQAETSGAQGEVISVDGVGVDVETAGGFGSKVIAGGVKYPGTLLVTQADLVAVGTDGLTHPSSGGHLYCNFNSAGKFVIRVKNNGNEAAPASITVVTGGRGTVAVPTPALAPGEVVDLPVNFTSFAACNSDCFFTITVDAAGQVNERVEGNAFSGWCIG